MTIAAIINRIDEINNRINERTKEPIHRNGSRNNYFKFWTNKFK